mmetsp:Transcript_66833/g.168792  ORF Transcript_66833/g.168792 Transcript_66833/m.168792 type:complete len:205 (+) Transcript_66833:1038-1652(+)
MHKARTPFSMGLHLLLEKPHHVHSTLRMPCQNEWTVGSPGVRHEVQKGTPHVIIRQIQSLSHLFWLRRPDACLWIMSLLGQSWQVDVGADVHLPVLWGIDPASLVEAGRAGRNTILHQFYRLGNDLLLFEACGTKRQVPLLCNGMTPEGSHVVKAEARVNQIEAISWAVLHWWQRGACGRDVVCVLDCLGGWSSLRVRDPSFQL